MKSAILLILIITCCYATKISFKKIRECNNEIESLSPEMAHRFIHLLMSSMTIEQQTVTEKFIMSDNDFLFKMDKTVARILKAMIDNNELQSIDPFEKVQNGVLQERTNIMMQVDISNKLSKIIDNSVSMDGASITYLDTEDVSEIAKLRDEASDCRALEWYLNQVKNDFDDKSEIMSKITKVLSLGMATSNLVIDVTAASTAFAFGGPLAAGLAGTISAVTTSALTSITESILAKDDSIRIFRRALRKSFIETLIKSLSKASDCSGAYNKLMVDLAAMLNDDNDTQLSKILSSCVKSSFWVSGSRLRQYATILKMVSSMEFKDAILNDGTIDNTKKTIDNINKETKAQLTKKWN